MQKKGLITAVVLAAVVAVASGGLYFLSRSHEEPVNKTAAGTAVQNAGKIRFATLGTGSSWYVYGATIADVAHRYMPDLNFDVMPYSGGIGNVLLQAQNKADISISSNITNAWAKDGTMAFASTGANPNLRCIIGMLDQMYVAIAIRNGSDIKNLRDIAEKKLPIHMFTAEKGQTSEFTAQVVLKSLGCSYEDLKAWGGSVEHTDFASIVNAAKDGKCDLFIQQISAGHASFTELLLTADFRVGQLDDQSLEFMKSNGYSLATMPANTFPKQKESILCAGVNSTVNCNASLDEGVAYKIAKAVYEHPADLAQGHKGLGNFSQKLAADVPSNGGLPIHPGALRFYREIGLVK